MIDIMTNMAGTPLIKWIEMKIQIAYSDTNSSNTSVSMPFLLSVTVQKARAR